MSETKRRRRNLRQAEHADSSERHWPRRLTRFARTNAIALGALVVSIFSVYYSHLKEESRLISKINRGWVEADVVKSQHAVDGTIDVTLLFSNDGNRPAIIERLNWRLLADAKSYIAAETNGPDECNVGLGSTMTLGKQAQFGDFPLVVRAGSFEILALQLPLQIPLALITEPEAGVHICFVVVFSDFLGREFTHSTRALTLYIQDLSRVSGFSLNTNPERLL